ncbi:MAG: alpha-amylase family glycosyl hydrolase [Bacteroidales bacterium]|nr:alpha amylase C-terminal domain-containing protein [Bacteroidales bacterium]MCI5482709.1 alpha-amylase family glycosyl hydrolase [Bacteroidales bacterium]MDY2878358.1 alpha-amylase family glycosyl hydrolase [Candidatus Cryptobacteroides sp.]
MKQIIYQALPRLWGKGHFSDWTGKAFSYLKTLGVDYLWLTGVPRHESGTPFTKGCPGSPYAIIDWYDVNPYLADNENKRMHEFELLIKRAHLAGIKIMIDYIPNHVGRSYAGDLPCFDHCDGDWTDTRKVNWNDPSTVDKMVDILCFWANKGIDGFRCDMVELVSAEALGEVVRRTRSAFPGLVFVAETYIKENYRRYLSTSSIDILYDKSGSYDILRAISNGNCSATALTSNWQWQAEIQGAMLNFLENHDEQRLASRFWNNGRRYPWAELAFSVLFNEASFMLYYGQEWMDDAAETDNGRTSIYDFTSPSGVRRAAHFARTGKAIKLNDAADTDSLDCYRRYLELMQTAASPLMRQGSNWDLCYLQNDCKWNRDNMFAFARYDGHGAAVVICNFSDSDTELSVRLPEELLKYTGGMRSINMEARAGDYSIIYFFV